MEYGLEFDSQVTRIVAKLDRARAADPQLQAFGARLHRYEIGAPLNKAELLSFEDDIGVSLPPDFKAFLTRVGHGAPLGQGAAAGPFYGIMPLNREKPGIGSPQAVRLQPTITSDMSDAKWQSAVAKLDADNPTLDEAENDARTDAAFAALYGGLLRLGHQGCDNYHALVVVGPDTGRVVNLDMDQRKPRFAPDQNFLDWYERWLDQVIDGTLLRQNADWFGYEGALAAR